MMDLDTLRTLLVRVEVDDLAHEVWAAAQLAPGEGIEDGVERVRRLIPPS